MTNATNNAADLSAARRETREARRAANRAKARLVAVDRAMDLTLLAAELQRQVEKLTADSPENASDPWGAAGSLGYARERMLELVGSLVGVEAEDLEAGLLADLRSRG